MRDKLCGVLQICINKYNGITMRMSKTRKDCRFFTKISTKVYKSYTIIARGKILQNLKRIVSATIINKNKFIIKIGDLLLRKM